MRRVAILGSGDLAATLARRLAERELARAVVLVDADDGRARGKALDIAQSGPVEGFDCVVEGARDLATAGPCDALVVADAPDLADLGGQAASPRLVEAVRSGVRSGPVLVAVAHACGLVEALVESGLARERVLGSVAIAQSGALRRHLADELGTEPSGIAAHVLGRPPHALIAPREAATVGGVRVDARAPAALRRALGEVNRRAPGPVALAEAAACLFRALRGSRPTVLPVVAVLRGEYGHRGRALAVPAGVAAGALQEVVEAALDPVERVALDNALRGL